MRHPSETIADKYTHLTSMLCEADEVTRFMALSYPGEDVTSDHVPGYLTLLKLPAALRKSGVLPNPAHRLVNYGIDALRYPAKARIGERMTVRFREVAQENRENGIVKMTIECAVTQPSLLAPVLVGRIVIAMQPSERNENQ